MSSQDDISQLMPSLYSRVKLTHSADETAELMQYASAHRVPNSVTLNSPALSSKLPFQQLDLAVPPEPQLPLVRHRLVAGRGSGRIVARRAFDLQLRLPNSFQQAATVPSVSQVPDRGHENAQASASPSAAHSPAPRQAEDPADSNYTEAVLHMLQDISNKRLSQLEQHAGSGRSITKRKFEVILPTVHPPPQPEAVAKSAAGTPHHAALATPQATLSAATISRASARSKASNAASCGSAMEGVPERPWRSIGKTPRAAASPALSLALTNTPMEGVPERVDQPHTAIRRQSYNSRLRTPGSTGQTPGKQQKHSCRTQQRVSRLGVEGSDTPRPETLLRLQLPANDEAQPLEESPVVGLLEAQQQPEQQQQATGADQYGSLGFFGSLNTAPSVGDDAGASTPGNDAGAFDDMDEGGYDDFSDDAEPDQLQSPAAVLAGNDEAESPAKGEEQDLAPTGMHPTSGSWQTKLSSRAPSSTHSRQAAPSSVLSDQPHCRSQPRFHEMEVQTGRSLQNSPAPATADAAVLAHSLQSDQLTFSPQQAADEEPVPEAAPKPVRKSEAHQRLKQVNKQRRSLAGEGLHGEQGVRRSSRDKRAPLEYWRNERKVYNREFRSLPTVHHYATRTPSPSWKFVQDLPHRKRSRLAPNRTDDSNA